VETSPAIRIIPAQRLNQFQEARKHALLIHHLQSRFILPTVEEQERCDKV
jgi:isochorismate hydrolase